MKNNCYFVQNKKRFNKLLILFLVSLLQLPAYSQSQNGHSIFQWIGAIEKVKALDHLIEQSNDYALFKKDYNTILLKKFIQQAGVLSHYKDSLATELSIQKAATHFFNDLAYGNKPPVLDYRGAKFDLTAYNVPDLIKTYNSRSALKELVTYLNEQSIEVKTILDSLHLLQKNQTKNKYKISLLITGANHYRWLNAIRKQQNIVLVNIPSAQLKVYNVNKVELEMRLILGKPNTPTKTLSTYIHQVTINPYWTVPKSIIVKEMLPKIKNDKNYLTRNHLSVLNADYKTIHPIDINWYTIDTLNFPYIIRQATGCENALGILKLEFENPFSIYLHDTPEKQLFKLKSRFLSHGCMRMENPIGMGRFLLADNLQAIDSIDLTQCNQNLKPTFIPLNKKMPLVVWYSQIDFDSNYKISFYKDVYSSSN